MNGGKSLRGILVLVPTVFDEKGDLDLQAYKENLSYLESVGLHGIVAMASVGQYQLLNFEEFKKVASAAREVCDKMACVIGTHTQSTRETIARTKYAEEIGADCAYFLNPYYSTWLDAESYYAHVKAISDATSRIKLMVYNFEASGFTIDITLWDRLLTDFPRIAVVKECTPLIEAGELMRKYANRFAILCGAETSLYPFMLMGGAGTVGVYCTGYPEFLLALYNACVEKRWDEALKYHKLLNAYRLEWQNGPYHKDNKGIATAAGRQGGFQRPPFQSPDQRDIEFHQKWLKRLNEAVAGAEVRR